jgi:hypothetical protein
MANPAMRQGTFGGVGPGLQPSGSMPNFSQSNNMQ